MLLIGKNITQSNDPLTTVSVDRVYKALQNEQGEIATLQHRLQIMRGIDVNQYRKMKTALPYIVCAHFHPLLRRKENFVYTERFLVDIDHLSEYDIDLITIKKKLVSDNRVELLFSSPGGDGLKILFKLSEKITESGYYSMFYKAFCIRFAEAYQLGAAVDIKTNDVSRCCFVSYDAQAYYNSAAEAVIAADYLQENNFTALDLLSTDIKHTEKANKLARAEMPETVQQETRELSDDVLNAIKQKIGQKIKTPRVKQFEQPEALVSLIPRITAQLESVGVQLQKNAPIAYGRQITIKAANHWAEVNVFYGKRGVRIVGTTKTGSNKTLCDMMVEVLKQNFEDNQND
jgi:hypothetical protein